jgi:endoglucanase
MAAGTKRGQEDPTYRINPSYCAPANYRIFADVDSNHQWNSLADDCYALIRKITKLTGNTTDLPPNWIDIDKRTNSAKPADGVDSTVYGFDAFRLFWRIALDHIWFGSPAAADYLSRTTPFFENEWKKGAIKAIYTLDGHPYVSYESLAPYAGVLAVLGQTTPGMAKQIYENEYIKKFNFDEGYWQDKTNYYDQNWAWFGATLYTGRLPNLWKLRQLTQK